ncbi:hypothetical protein BCV71DRAFT_189698, partial [Rhizopus microsporus]
LGWLPGYKAIHCLRRPSRLFTKQHTIYCLDMHCRLQIPETKADPLPFLLNKFPTHKLRF